MPPVAPAARRVVLVGCLLDGTSLATPRRLRNALSWLTNVNQALATGLVISNFDPTPVGLQICKFVTEAEMQAANSGADLIFPQKHDLVVDTDSMIHIVGVHQQPGAVQIVNHFVHDFGTGSTVRATNYFRQAPLYTFLRETALQQTQ
jgi:hypothetical protein